ncbi:CHASE domain-containing protein [Crocosphaera sp.]|uniref:CHASE domain-containing protein n=1 Tax=Crocosphaera sp. TaxID=2729996 RepID=UPI003F259E6B|nr:CHASE domain-containing protein [Crocosphaera sp.]
MKSPFSSRFLSLYLPLVISVFMGGGLSLIVALIHWSSEVYKVKTNFEKQGDHLVEHLQEHIKEYINITQGLGAFYDSSAQVTRQDFKLFTRNFLDENLGILGMAWVPRISQKERFLYEKNMRNSGFSDFEIWSKNQTNLNDKNEYFPVTYGEPQPIYKSVIGLELSSNDVFNSPLEKARDTGEITASQPIDLINGGQGFMLYYPVYRRESYPQTIEKRRQEFRGIVYTVYRIEDLIQMTLNHLSSSHPSFYLTNTKTLEENSIIFSFDINTKKINTSTTIPFTIPLSCQILLSCRRQLTVADTEWFLTVIPEINPKIIVIKSLFVLLLGLGITTLITIYLWKTLSEKKDIEKVITERTYALIKTTKDLEKTIKKRTEQLENSNEEKSQILDKINHELRVPLNNMLGFLYLFNNNNNLTAEQKHSLNTIKTNSQYLLNLFDQILEFSNLKSGQVSLQWTVINLENLVTSIFRKFKEQAEMKQLKLNYYIDPEISPYMKIDENKIRKILINLIDNAIQFTDKGHIIIRFFCDNQAWLINNSNDNNIDTIDQKNLWIEVEDNGTGIPVEIHSKVFEPFFRASKNKGVGLGLSITHKLVDLMGGKIYLKSQLGRGTIVQFHLPVIIPKPEEIKQNHRKGKVVSLASYEPDYRILVIDEQDYSRKLLINFLQPIGFKIKETSDLKNAFSISQSWHPHLIFIDTKLLLSDNDLLINSIKNCQSLDEIIIIGIASGKIENNQVDKLQLWCNDCLYKPFAIGLILEKISYHLGVHYCYENEEIELISTEKIIKKLTPSALTMMSSEWLQKVYWAASAGNRSILEKLIQQIPENNYSVTSGMMELVDNFNYRKIREIIEPLINKS